MGASVYPYYCNIMPIDRNDCFGFADNRATPVERRWPWWSNAGRRINGHVRKVFDSSRNAVCEALRARGPASTHAGVWRPHMLGALSARRHDGTTDTIAVEQRGFLMQPAPTPPLPAKAPSITEAPHAAPDRLLDPVFDEAEALAGISSSEVIHSAA
jgi:hypothetical protein